MHQTILFFFSSMLYYALAAKRLSSTVSAADRAKDSLLSIKLALEACEPMSLTDSFGISCREDKLLSEFLLHSDFAVFALSTRF